MNTHVIVKAAAAVGAGIALAVAIPLSASAHVTISPNTSPPGGYALLDIKVPNESATAVTTKLEVTLPTDHPFLSVSYVPVAGWTTTFDRASADQPVTRVTWTAAKGAGIQAGQLQLFPLSLGPVPKVGSTTLTATQYYSDGSVVKWADKGADAEHPAPVLYVEDAAPGAPAPATATAAPAGGNPAGENPPGETPDVVARVLGIAGLVIGAVGLVLAVTSRRREAR